jgi:hypothetical protein
LGTLTRARARARRVLADFAVGREIRPGCLKVVAHVETKRLADLLAERLSEGDY